VLSADVSCFSSRRLSPSPRLQNSGPGAFKFIGVFKSKRGKSNIKGAAWVPIEIIKGKCKEKTKVVFSRGTELIFGHSRCCRSTRAAEAHMGLWTSKSSLCGKGTNRKGKRKKYFLVFSMKEVIFY
jgi:hypothetical protein